MKPGSRTWPRGLRYRGYYTDWKQMVQGPGHRDHRQRHPGRPAPCAFDRGRRGRQARHLREAAGDDGPGRRGHARGRREGRREAHVLLQLPLLPGRAPGQRADRDGRARQDLPFPRALSAGAGPRPRGAARRRVVRLGHEVGHPAGDRLAHHRHVALPAGRHRGVERPGAHLQPDAHRRAPAHVETVTADEGNLALVEFASGATGTLESSGVATGHRNQHTWEINGAKGSLAWDLEDPNHLQVFIDGAPPPEVRGFTNVSVTDPGHPLADGVPAGRTQRRVGVRPRPRAAPLRGLRRRTTSRWRRTARPSRMATAAR